MILVVDDDELVRKSVRLTCESEGYAVTEVERGVDALPAFEATRPDMVLLDLMMPDMSGFDICRDIRRAGHRVPVVILSAKNDEIDVVLGLEIGADVTLTHTEFDLLAFLAGNAGEVLSRDRILSSVWGYEHPIETRVIDVHVRNLRRKIEPNPSQPRYILAVPGIGYRFTNTRPENGR
jgi:two-component system response regulator MtrA